MQIVCLDLEGVLVPEIWVEFAKQTGIDALKATTQDCADYSLLMDRRLEILAEHQLGLYDIQQVIKGMAPLSGARDFIDWLRERAQVVILSDTFYEFAQPLIKQLGFPTLLCHHLEVDSKGFINGYRLRQANAKRQAVKAFQSLNYRVIAAGDSYNDIAMLEQAEFGVLFKAPAVIIREFPQFKAIDTFEQLKHTFENIGTQ